MSPITLSKKIQNDGIWGIFQESWEIILSLFSRRRDEFQITTEHLLGVLKRRFKKLATMAFGYKYYVLSPLVM
jgi:hypothetical protein